MRVQLEVAQEAEGRATAAAARAEEEKASVARVVEVMEAAAREEAAAVMRVAWEATRVAVPGKLRLCHRRR